MELARRVEVVVVAELGLDCVVLGPSVSVQSFLLGLLALAHLSLDDLGVGACLLRPNLRLLGAVRGELLELGVASGVGSCLQLRAVVSQLCLRPDGEAEPIDRQGLGLLRPEELTALVGFRIHVYLLGDKEPRALLTLSLVRLLANRFSFDLALQVVGHVALLLFAAEIDLCLLELVLLLIVRRNLVPD